MHIAESSNVVNFTTVSEPLSGYWSLWTARVLLLLAVLLAVWDSTNGAVPLVVWAAVSTGLIAQFAFFIAAVFKQLPVWHTWVTALVTLTITALTWSVVPAAEYPLLLLAPIVMVDVARTFGWNSLLLLVIFPFAPLLFTNLFQSGRLMLDSQIWGFWVVAVVVAVTLVRPSDQRAPKARATRGDLLQGILAGSVHSFVDAAERDQILAILTRSGIEILDYNRRRSPSRAFVLTFREGLRDLLQVAAVHNLEPALLGTVYELQGVLSNIVEGGAAFDLDAAQPPFKDIRSLRNHRLLMLPLRTGVDLYGAVLFATTDEVRASDNDVQRSLLALSAQAAMALHNRVLLHQLQGGGVANACRTMANCAIAWRGICTMTPFNGSPPFPCNLNS